MCRLRQLLAVDGTRLVTLTGAGGAGKTTLALEVGRQVEPGLPDGAGFIDLSTVDDLDALPIAACRALGLVGQTATPLRALLDYLAPRQLLLMLDNCEHLLPHLTALIDLLLDQCPDIRILATSRRRLGVRGETIHAVPPLVLPGVDTVEDLQALARVAAIELFVDRAQAVDPGFELGDWATSVTTICHRVDGLPLAIELAAAQLTALTPPEIETRLRALVGTGRASEGTPARQRTMDATLAWSHDLLDEQEQAVFRRLAAFRGGWTLAAAEEVCGLATDPTACAATLASLVDQSLVIREHLPTAGRFRLLAPVAEYAAERLEAAGEQVPIALAHATHYLSVIARETPDWREIEPEQVDLIAAEYENCCAALDVAEREGLVTLVVGLNLSLLLFWRIRGLLRPAMSRLEAALALVDDGGSTERAVLLAALAHLGQLVGDLETAAARAAESEAILAATEDVITRRTVIGFLGDIAASRGDIPGAMAHYARARALVTEAASDLDLGFWHANTGRMLAQGGDLAGAEGELEQALGHLRSSSPWYQGYVLVQLGSLARRRGELEIANDRLREALGHLHRYGAAIEAATCLDELAQVASRHQDHIRATTLFAAATGLRDRIGHTLEPDARRTVDGQLDRTRAALADAVFTQAWRHGHGLSLDDAVAFTMSPAAHPIPRSSIPPGDALTAREREVAQLVALGLTNRQIAERLVIATGTARTHVERILGKLGLTSRVQIATWVVRAPDSAGTPEPA